MPLTIDATVGGAAANSFVTAAEMTTYCEGRLNASVWTASAAQEPALVEATRELSALEWDSVRTSTTQALAWPATYATNPDAAFGASQWYDSDIIPQRIKDATCELALQFLKAGTTDIAAIPETDGVIEKTVDVLTTRYSEFSRKQGLRRFPSVWRYIRPLLRSSSSVVFQKERN